MRILTSRTRRATRRRSDASGPRRRTSTTVDGLVAAIHTEAGALAEAQGSPLQLAELIARRIAERFGVVPVDEDD